MDTLSCVFYACKYLKRMLKELYSKQEKKKDERKEN